MPVDVPPDARGRFSALIKLGYSRVIASMRASVRLLSLFKRSWLLVLLILLIDSGNVVRSTESDFYLREILADMNYDSDVVQNLVNSGKQYLGRPYRFRNVNGDIMDCSGFVGYLFSLQGIKLPRTSRDMGAALPHIPLGDVRVGDLLFFTGSNSHIRTVGHVSMVVETYDTGLKMIHSSSRGVVIDDFPTMSSYMKRFLFAGRVPQLQTKPYPGEEVRGDSEVLKTPELILPSPSTFVADPLLQSNTKDEISIIGVGDMMLGTNYPSKDYLPPNDGRELLAPVRDILSAADLCCANLEGAILSGEGPVKQTSDPSKCYAFKSPDGYVNLLKDAGIDAVSLANNHVNDFGDPGKTNTVRMLSGAGIEFAGLLEYPSATFTKEGIRYGFCAFAPNKATVKINDYDEARKIIGELDSQSDIVIVFFHGGGEGSNYRHITRNHEIYLDEDRGNPYEFARMAIDAGADVVFGSGPHVTRAIDLYKNRFIAYSLGNFCTYGRFSLSGEKGLAPIVEVKVGRSGEFRSAKIISTKQIGEGGTLLDPDNGALRSIRSLTAQDIPECPLQITEDGSVTKSSSRN
jgi:hypothetical protein